jgi:hypothetical protein
MKDNAIPTDIKSQLKDMFPQFSLDKAQKQPKLTTKDYSPERIQAIIDGLDEQLAKGKISEETYQELRKKWKSKLNN